MPEEFRPYLRELEQNGVVVIPNFLSKDDYARFKEEYERLSSLFTPDGTIIALPHVDRLSLHDSHVTPATQNIFLNNPLISSIATAYLNRTYNLQVGAYLTKIYCSEQELALPKNGGTNNIHFDAPTRVLKAFYYVNETTESNSAFHYGKKTNHRNSLKRLWFEYKLSIRYALNRWNPEHGGEYLDDEPWVKITEAELNEHGISVEPIRGKGNTLVLADTGGFHRRGSFSHAGSRETVEINFRNIESIRNDLYPLERKITQLINRVRQGPPDLLSPKKV